MKSTTHRRALELLARARVHAAAVVPGVGGGGVYIFSAMRVLGHGADIDGALANARETGNLPDFPPFPAFRSAGVDVEMRGTVIASAISANLAERIANALNLYHPNERGR
jgi:hypothetical protein